MRALLASLMLLAVAVPATATHETLLVSDLVITFNPTTQATEFSFTLKNNGAAKTGSIILGLHDDVGEVNNLPVDAAGLAAGAEKDYVVSAPARLTLNGCILVVGTGSRTVSNEACAGWSGLSQAPAAVPTVPEDPTTLVPETGEPPEAPEAPEDPTTLLPPAPEVPEDPTTLLPPPPVLP